MASEIWLSRAVPTEMSSRLRSGSAHCCLEFAAEELEEEEGGRRKEEGRKEKEGEGGREGGREGRKEGRKKGRKEGRTEGEGRKEGREGRREEGRKGGTEGGRKEATLIKSRDPHLAGGKNILLFDIYYEHVPTARDHRMSKAMPQL